MAEDRGRKTEDRKSRSRTIQRNRKIKLFLSSILYHSSSAQRTEDGKSSPFFYLMSLILTIPNKRQYRRTDGRRQRTENPDQEQFSTTAKSNSFCLLFSIIHLLPKGQKTENPTFSSTKSSNTYYL